MEDDAQTKGKILRWWSKKSKGDPDRIYLPKLSSILTDFGYRELVEARCSVPKYNLAKKLRKIESDGDVSRKVDLCVNNWYFHLYIEAPKANGVDEARVEGGSVPCKIELSSHCDKNLDELLSSISNEECTEIQRNERRHGASRIEQ